MFFHPELFLFSGLQISQDGDFSVPYVQFTSINPFRHFDSIRIAGCKSMMIYSTRLVLRASVQLIYLSARFAFPRLYPALFTIEIYSNMNQFLSFLRQLLGLIISAFCANWPPLFPRNDQRQERLMSSHF